MPTSRPRASDAQRRAVQHSLDDAFAAGQLDHFEHFERTRKATRARFVDELRPLVADLRGGNDDLGLSPADSEPAPRDTDDAAAGETEKEGTTAKRAILVSGGFAVAFVVAGTVAASIGDSGGVDPPAPGPMHTPDGMTRMLDAAETEFGGHEIDSLAIYGDRAILMYEDPTEPGKRLSHVFRGQWEEPTFHSRTDGPTFRLEDIDPDVVVAAIDIAPDELDMDDDTRTSHVSVYPDALGDPEFVINVAEGVDEPLGSLTVGVDGSLREVRPPE